MVCVVTPLSAWETAGQTTPTCRVLCAPEFKVEPTHKLNLELDTSLSVFNWLPEGRSLRGVELEGSFDYVASGLPKAGEIANGTRFLDDASPWSFSIVVVIPVAPC